jgi:hypothetical protein
VVVTPSEDDCGGDAVVAVAVEPDVEWGVVVTPSEDDCGGDAVDDGKEGVAVVSKYVVVDTAVEVKDVQTVVESGLQ